MSVEDDRLPPVPQHLPPITTDPAGKSRFETTWMHWFLQVKMKVDVINATIKNLGALVGQGFTVKTTTGQWISRTILGTTGRVTVTNGNGVAGDPIVDVVTAGFIASSIVDGDLLKAPDGNSVFDALALKAPLTSPAFLVSAGFNGTAPITKPTVTGAKGGNAALTSLIAALVAYGLITDSTT